MSYLVLHMDKFKKEAIRGIQSHNRRERESHSNPDIDYDRSAANYELHEVASSNYAEAIQNRIDDLLLVKAVRKDAVRMCGLIVTSDKAFFDGLTPEETRRFLMVSRRRKQGVSLRRAKPFSRSLWARRMSFPQWFTWMKRRRTCTSFTCR